MYIRLDKLGADEHILNLEIMDNDDKVPNGAIVEVGAYTGYDKYEANKIADVDGDLAMIVVPFLDRTGFEEESEMAFAKGQVVRGIPFRKQSSVTITLDGVDGTPVVGEYLIPQVGSYKLKPSATKAGSLCYKVVALESMYGQDAVYLEAVL